MQSIRVLKKGIMSMREEAGCLASGKLFTGVASFSVSGEFVFLGVISHPLLMEEGDPPPGNGVAWIWPPCCSEATASV